MAVAWLLPTCWPAAQAAPLNDTYYGVSWHHAKIGSEAAWAISEGSSDVIVAVIDTGVDAAHPDLAGRVIAGWNLVTNSPDTSPTYWHGTAVAGVIAAVRNNGRGVAGLADVSIMPVIVSPDDTISASQAAGGIRWAVDHGAKVINISAPLFHVDALHQAVQYAWDRGALVVMSTENEETLSREPAWDELIVVSSSDPNDQLYRSQAGKFLDLLAPGVNIYSTYAYPDRPGAEYYCRAWGTSFAAPMVTAAAALAWSINPLLTPAEVRDILFGTAVDLETPGWDMLSGHGRLNLAGVAQAAYDSIPEPGCLAILLLGSASILRRKRRAQRPGSVRGGLQRTAQGAPAAG